MSIQIIASIVSLLVGTICIDLTAAQRIERCGSIYLRNGGFCRDRGLGCPTGTSQFSPFSNFLGCGNVNRICCTWNPGPTVRQNPTAPIVVPPERRCGVGSGLLGNRILSGRITGPCDWPFVVSIRGLIRGETRLDYDTTLHSCAGVLVADDWVLTSPFCVLSAGTSADWAPQNILVVAGEYNVSRIDYSPTTGRQQEQFITVERAFIHPNYRYRTIEEIIPPSDNIGINSNAVALLKLREPIRGECSGVVCLPTPEDVGNDCAAYEDCVITGWGFATETITQDASATTLLIGQNRLSSRVACDFLSQRLGLEAGRPMGTICQGPKNRVVDACLGDEGGAVLCNSNGRNWFVRAILPFNICVNNQYNMFFTDIAPYMQWVSNTMYYN